jgi:hypothetical protein
MITRDFVEELARQTLDYREALGPDYTVSFSIVDATPTGGHVFDEIECHHVFNYRRASADKNLWRATYVAGPGDDIEVTDETFDRVVDAVVDYFEINN